MIKWLYDDAKLLKENNREKGCICLLLCLMDALAKKSNPTESNNKERYVIYIKIKLQEIGEDQSFRIEKENKMRHLSEIIYEYFRCYFVHEGDSRGHDMYEVQIEYDDPGIFRFKSGLLIDRVREKVIVKSDWLIDVLFKISETEISL